jgi:hypothetical protein
MNKSNTIYCDTTIKIKSIDKDRYYFIHFKDRTLTGYYSSYALQRVLLNINL